MSIEESRVIVPVNGTSLDERSIDVAILLARRFHAPVTAIHVVEVPLRLPLDADLPAEVARGEAILQEAQHRAVEYSYDLEVELLQARKAGPAIVDEAIGRRASLIVMGAEIHRRAGEETFGLATVPYVLKNAPCEVIVCRQALPG